MTNPISNDPPAIKDIEADLPNRSDSQDLFTTKANRFFSSLPEWANSLTQFGQWLGQKVTNVHQYEQAAAQHVEAAKTEVDNANSAAQQASGFADAAQQHASIAQQQAHQSEQSATNAAQQVSLAEAEVLKTKTEVNRASEQADRATTQADTAENWSQQSQQYANDAQGHSDQAAAYRDEAQGYAAALNMPGAYGNAGKVLVANENEDGYEFKNFYTREEVDQIRNQVKKEGFKPLFESGIFKGI